MAEADPIERMHADMDGVQFPAQGDALWLASPEAVNPIVTSFMSDFLERYGELPAEEFMTWLRAECERMNSLFLGWEQGETPGQYERMIWHTPAQLGQSIGANLGFEGDTDTAVRDAFMIVAMNLGKVIDRNEGAPIEEWGWQLDGLVEELCNALLGLPVVDPDDLEEAEEPATGA